MRIPTNWTPDISLSRNQPCMESPNEVAAQMSVSTQCLLSLPCGSGGAVVGVRPLSPIAKSHVEVHR